MVTTNDQIRDYYNRTAFWYDCFISVYEWLIFRRLRRKLIAKARGEVVEIGCGSGLNFKYYSDKVLYIRAVDLSAGMIARAKRRAAKNREVLFGISVDEMDVADIWYPPRTADTVVSTLSLCTFTNPMAALQKMTELCDPVSGRILLLEHGRSSNKRLAYWQDRRTPKRVRKSGCHLNRDPIALVKAAGLDIVSAERYWLGTIYLIEAKPANAL